MEYEEEILSHTWELHLSEITSSQTFVQISNQKQVISPFELSLLMGMMAHPVSSFTTEQSTSSVQMVTGSYDMITKRHTSGLQIPKLTDKLRMSIDIFYKQAEQWKHWMGKEISNEDAKTCFEAMPNISERRVEQLMRQFKIEVSTHGRTVWALYSAATYYATSNEGQFAVRTTAQDHAASTLINREQQVRSWQNTEQFLAIAA